MKKLNIPIDPIMTYADHIRSLSDEELAAPSACLIGSGNL